jgi:methyl-accepting chemotaxis protein
MAVGGQPRPLGRLLGNRRVNTKIVVSLLVSAFAMIGVASVGVVCMAQMNARAGQLYNKSMIPLSHLGQLHDAQLLTRVVLHRLLVQSTATGRESTQQLVRAADDDLTTALATYKQTSALADSAAMHTFETNWTAYLAIRDQKLQPLALAGDTTAFGTIENESAQPLIANSADALDELGTRETAIAARLAGDATRTYRNGRLTIVLFLVLGIALSMLLGQYVARLIVRPLRRVSKVLEGVADGDLTDVVGVNSADELGRMATALDRANARTRQVVQGFAASTATLARVANDTSEIGTRIAAQAVEATAQSGLASATAAEVSANVQSVASGTEEMRASIAEISSSSSRAVAVANDAVTAAQATNETVARLGVSSAEIDSVVKLITSIAEQTNLLALNATIEAARAGDAGKGFAVVAGEVKDLAQATAKATEDITRRVQAIQTDASSAVGAIAEILRVVDEIARYLQTIAMNVDEQTTSAAEISRGSAEAAHGSATIAANISSVLAAARSTSEGIDQSRESSAELSRMSGQLQDLVRQFRY